MLKFVLLKKGKCATKASNSCMGQRMGQCMGKRKYESMVRQ